MENDKLLRPGEAARRLGVDVKTLHRWSNAGRVPSVRTLGGHRRYRASVIDGLLQES